MTQTLLLARQPIFDRQLKVVAYELLFRGQSDAQNKPGAGDHASSQVLVNTFDELSVEEITGNTIAFINFTRNLILNPPPINERCCVIEVLEDIEFDDTVIEGIKKVKQMGFRIALDDFVYSERATEALTLANIVKLDVLAFDKPGLTVQLQQLKPYKLTLLAEKVETHEMFEYCKALGFTLFQGFFLSKPQNVMGTTLPANKLAVLNLLGKIQDPNKEIKEIEDALAVDPSLVYKLLKLINSAGFRQGREIGSVRGAIVMLGLLRLKNWVTVLALADLSDKPQELMTNAIIRGKMCEGIAQTMGESTIERFFMVGLLSLIDAFFDRPLEAILNQLPLSSDTHSAILHRKGKMGFVLSTTIAYERAEWNQITWHTLKNNNIGHQELKDIYLDSIKAATDLLTFGSWK
ncbi:MAG: HDOD domain-containing protein [Gammaproteobacteria bacterium]|nr:HDOD domain-containing protein [Gammaproteobacteria bacterium]